MSRFTVLILALAICGCRDSRFRSEASRPQNLELWYWHHSYIVSPEAVTSSKVLIDRAARAGYTGMVLWDSSWIFINSPGWPAESVTRLKEVLEYAASRGLHVMPVVAPYGHSNDLLRQHPYWAEAQRVVSARFRVESDGRSLALVKTHEGYSQVGVASRVDVKIPVQPWHQYRVHLAVKTRAFAGVAQLEVFDGQSNRLDANLRVNPTQDWTALDYTFNSAESSLLRLVAGVFGRYEGELQVAQLSTDETALVYVIRRSGTPLRVYDPEQPATVFEEGRDFDFIQDQRLVRTGSFTNDNYHDPGPVTLPASTRLHPGQVVSLDYYAVVPVYDEAVSACLSDPAVMQWSVANARISASFLPKGSGLLLSHDEIRQMNSCALCRARRQTAGQLLAGHTREISGKLASLGPLYIWSDMYDPQHNAHANYAQVEGTVAGSWRGLGAEVTIMNWNLDHLRASLLWFSGDDPRQPVPHRQVIAGYYDPPDRNGAAAVRHEWAAAHGLPGIVGMMYTTWTNDYSQLEAFADTAREEWARYRDSRPF